MTDRLRCIVPFCRRTAPRGTGDVDEESTEIICGRHARLADKRLRRILSLNRKRLRALPVCESNLPAFTKMWAREQRLWERMKRQAIERAAGITA